jgi:hypothetical protein
MQCKYHHDRLAEFFCDICNAPLCKECAEEIQPGRYYCFQCAMLHSIREFYVSLEDKQEKGEEEREKSKWGTLQSFSLS